MNPVQSQYPAQSYHKCPQEEICHRWKNCVGTNEIFSQRRKRKIDSSSGEIEAGDDTDGGQRKISNQLIPKSHKPSMVDKQAKYLREFMFKFTTSPLANVCKTMQYFSDSQLTCIRANSELFKESLDIVSNLLTTKSIREFETMYNDPKCTPLFATPKGTLEKAIAVDIHNVPTIVMNRYFMSVEDSLSVCIKLLDIQTQNKKKEFLTDLCNVLGMKVSKKIVFLSMLLLLLVNIFTLMLFSIFLLFVVN